MPLSMLRNPTQRHEQHANSTQKDTRRLLLFFACLTFCKEKVLSTATLLPGQEEIVECEKERNFGEVLWAFHGHTTDTPRQNTLTAKSM